jgi:acetyl esterase/lipase
MSSKRKVMSRALWALLPFAVCSTSLRAQNMVSRDVDDLPTSAPTLVAAYGSDPHQVGELRLPPGKGPFPVVEVVHGGCWTKGFATRKNTAALASALTALGYATWNIEYRQIGDEGAGWPGTFKDWAAATDYLRVLAKSQPISLTRVAVVGHSAGAHGSHRVAACLPQATLDLNTRFRSVSLWQSTARATLLRSSDMIRKSAGNQ